MLCNILPGRGLAASKLRCRNLHAICAEASSILRIVPSTSYILGFTLAPRLWPQMPAKAQYRFSPRRLISSSANAQPQAVNATDAIPVKDISVGIPREIWVGERRVAITPDATGHLLKSGFGSVLVQAGAGSAASFRDEDYAAHGASIVSSAEAALSADVVLKVGQV